MLGHGDVLNAEIITQVEQVQIPATEQGGSAHMVPQMQDAHAHWKAIGVSCGMDHSAAVLSVSEALLGDLGAVRS